MGAAACAQAPIFCFLRPIARAIAPAATADMRPDLIARRIVDLLVPACSAACRRLKVVMCPVERVGPRCARLWLQSVREQGVAARAVPGAAGFYFVDHCSRPLPSVLRRGRLS